MTRQSQSPRQQPAPQEPPSPQPIEREEILSHSDSDLPEIVDRRVSEIDEQTRNKDREELRSRSTREILSGRNIFHELEAETTPLTRLSHTKAETARRIRSYTSAYENGWHTIDYKGVGGEEHERLIGLGDILLDPDIKVIEVQRRGITFRAKRKARNSGRISFLYDEDVPSLNKKKGDYVATFTGDKFRIKNVPDNRETSYSSEDDSEELRNYDERLKEEREQRLLYLVSLEHSYTSIYQIFADIESILSGRSIENPEEEFNTRTNTEIISMFQELSPENFMRVKTKVGSRNLRRLFRETGIDHYSQKEALSTQITNQINALEDNDTLVEVFGTKEELIKGILQTAAVESSFKPFNWSETERGKVHMGFFQFNSSNIESFGINPLASQQAVEGLLRLWKENLENADSGAERKPQLIFASHYLGITKVNELIQSEDFEAKGFGEQGNEYVQRIENINPDDFEDEEIEDYLSMEMRVIAPTSAPYETSDRGTTLCSRTAANNLEILGVDSPPRGNANDVASRFANRPDAIQGSSNADIARRLENLLSEGREIIAVDVFVEGSNTEAGRRYGHRAAAYRAFDGNWMILDPYRNGHRQGVSFDEYNGEIKFVIPHPLPEENEETLVATA